MRYPTTQKIERLIYQDDIELCWCSYENEYKPCTEFSGRPFKPGEHRFQYYCRSCHTAIKRGDLKPNVSIYTIQSANELLEKIGYKTDSDLTVHQQFLKKHFNDSI